jgi:hypothetical protein
MLDEKQNDIYVELYSGAKFTVSELQRRPELENFSMVELEVISDLLFDIGIKAQKIIMATHD